MVSEKLSNDSERPDNLLQTRTWKLRRVDRSSGVPRDVETTISLDSDDKYSKAVLEIIESIEGAKNALQKPASTDSRLKIEAYERSLRQYNRHLNILKGLSGGSVEFKEVDGVITKVFVDEPAE